MTVYGKDFADIYNLRWNHWTEKVWPFLADQAERWNPDAQSWLDLCCGTGALLKLVGEKGFQAVGLDNSPHQLKHARRNAPRARIIRADVREFALPGRFDIITCMYDSLNYLTKKQDILRVFRRVRRHLRRSGVFIFDINTFEGLEDGWCRTSVIRDRDWTVIIETSFEVKRALGRCVITGFVKTGPLFRKFEEEHIERGYRAEEIEELLVRNGFQFWKFDGYSLSRPKARSGRLLYVCRPQTH